MACAKTLKSALRKDIKIRLAALSEAEKRRQSAVVTNKLMSSPVYQESNSVSIFLSMSDEVQTYDILQDMLKAQKTCYIPKYVGDNMDMVRMYSMADYDKLPETSWKIKQPAKDDIRSTAFDEGGLDLIIMPGLGFSPEGERLGRGRGYYDNYLQKYKEKFGQLPTLVALAFKEQVQQNIPVDDHDVLIHTVLYEGMV